MSRPLLALLLLCTHCGRTEPLLDSSKSISVTVVSAETGLPLADIPVEIHLDHHIYLRHTDETGYAELTADTQKIDIHVVTETQIQSFLNYPHPLLTVHLPEGRAAQESFYPVYGKPMGMENFVKNGRHYIGRVISTSPGEVALGWRAGFGDPTEDGTISNLFWRDEEGGSRNYLIKISPKATAIAGYLTEAEPTGVKEAAIAWQKLSLSTDQGSLDYRYPLDQTISVGFEDVVTRTYDISGNFYLESPQLGTLRFDQKQLADGIMSALLPKASHFQDTNYLAEVKKNYREPLFEQEGVATIELAAYTRSSTHQLPKVRFPSPAPLAAIENGFLKLKSSGSYILRADLQSKAAAWTIYAFEESLDYELPFLLGQDPLETIIQPALEPELTITTIQLAGSETIPNDMNLLWRRMKSRSSRRSQL